MHPALSGVRAILFDFDETLAPDVAKVSLALERVLTPLLERRSFDVAEAMQAVRGHARSLWRGSEHYPYVNVLGVSSWEALWARFEGDSPAMTAIRQWVTAAYRPAVWEGLLGGLEIAEPGLAGQLDGAFQRERRALGAELYPETEAVLDRLAGRYSMALVTNGLSCLQREKVTASGLGGRFQAVVVSGDIGHGKPEPAAFHAALAALALAPEAVIMVGDSLERDIAGAQAAGIAAVWVNRTGAATPPDTRANHMVTDLNGLLELLA